MATRLNWNVFKILGRVAIIVAAASGVMKLGWIGLHALAVKVRNDDAAAARNVSANELTASLQTLKDHSIDYSILSPHVMRVTEGDVVYRFNFASGIVSVRGNLDNSTRTDQQAVMGFQQMGHPGYVDELKAIGCRTALVSAPAVISKADLSIYTQDQRQAIDVVYDAVREFGKLNCP